MPTLTSTEPTHTNIHTYTQTHAHTHITSQHTSPTKAVEELLYY
jgi:hypothetical protein